MLQREHLTIFRSRTECLAAPPVSPQHGDGGRWAPWRFGAPRDGHGGAGTRSERCLCWFWGGWSPGWASRALRAGCSCSPACLPWLAPALSA